MHRQTAVQDTLMPACTHFVLLSHPLSGLGELQKHTLSFVTFTRPPQYTQAPCRINTALRSNT